MKSFGIKEALAELEIKKSNAGASTGKKWFSSGKSPIESYSPVDGKLIGSVYATEEKDFEKIVAKASEAFKQWRSWPAPKRGEIVRQIGESLRKQKEPLGKLVSYEMGKSYQEGLGEVQEMIDICDFAVGLSRQLHGLTMHSERPEHRMYEQWHPIGIVGIITAFNFPVAVWAWNAMIAWVCGDVCIWKPSEKTPLCGIACQKIAAGFRYSIANRLSSIALSRRHKFFPARSISLWMCTFVPLFQRHRTGPLLSPCRGLHVRKLRLHCFRRVPVTFCQVAR